MLAARIVGGERVLGVVAASPLEGALEGASRGWVVVTDRRAGVALEGDAAWGFWEASEEEPLTLARSRSRDRVQIGTRALLQGPLMGGATLRRLVELGAMPAQQRLMSAAQELGQALRWADAQEALEVALALPDAAEDAAHHAQLLMWRARASFELGASDVAMAQLAELTARRPEDDLLALSASAGATSETWLAALALAHEAAADHRAAAAVYRALADAPDAPLARRHDQARAHARAGELEAARRAYEALLGGLPSGVDFGALSQLTREVDARPRDARREEATLELGALLEQLSDWEAAAELYLGWIRQAPLARSGYAALFKLRERLAPHQLEGARQAALVLRLLDRRMAQDAGEVVEALCAAGQGEDLCALGAEAKISDADYERALVHPGEREDQAVAQRWLGGLLSDTRASVDIERHCERLNARQHPDALRFLTKVAQVLGVATPRCYLSHGMTGVQVMRGGAVGPLILMGAAHWELEHAQYLDASARRFALATQVAHIRAEHLVLTSSEFWGAFRSKALEGVVAGLSLIPLGGMLGKLTDNAALSALAKLKERVEGGASRTLAGYLERQLTSGGTGGPMQSAYEAALGVVASRGRGAPQQGESLLKEQLANFARAAMYSADRVGLLACDDLDAAVRAILLLSPRASQELIALQEGGLVSVLDRRDGEEPVYGELALRLGELMRFALSGEYLSLRRGLYGAPAIAGAP